MSHDRSCASCAHFRGHIFSSWYGHECARLKFWNRVTGRQDHRYLNCHTERAPRFLWFGKDRCGPEAQYWEAAPEPAPPRGGSAVRGPAPRETPVKKI